jgi:signal transduction histidine kinase
VGRTVERINGLIAKLGSLRREIQLNPVACRLDQLSAEVLAALEAKGPGGGRLVRDLQPVPEQSLDREALHSVVTNLVLNAREALDGGEGEVRVATRREGDAVLLEVADTGCGMTPEFVRTRLFRPFESTKSKGLGIGMFQCRKIVEAHGGRIAVESRPGSGTRFTVVLPLAPDPQPQPVSA